MNNNDINNLARLLTEKVNKKMDMESDQTATLTKGSGEGPEAVKLETPIEYGKTKDKEGSIKPIEMKKKDVKTEGVTNMIKSSFDQLFSNTINEQDEMFNDTEEGSEGVTDLDVEGDIESEVSDEDVGEEVDVATRLEMILDDLTSVISAIRGESEEGEDDFSGEETTDDFGAEESEDDFSFGEAVSQPEPKSFSDAGGKKLMGKGNIKVPGTVGKAAPAKGSIGNLKNQPEPKNLPDTGKKLMSKSNIKVKAPGIKNGQPIVT